MEPTKLLTPKEVSEIYKLSIGTLSNDRVSGCPYFPFVKLKGRIFYRLQDIEHVIEKNLFHSTGECQQAQREA